jgi:exonuclease SbcC
MENIRSYKNHAINFPTGTSLFEGDIGSGKSTILMAVEFALFGLGNQKGDSLLRKGSKRGSVLLEFEVEGSYIQVRKSLVRKDNISPVRQEKGILSIDGKKIDLSPSEIKERILKILNFKEPINPRAQSVIFRYAIYTPQEDMKFILSQKPDLRLETLRKAFGIEDYKIAAENATLISRVIKEKFKFLEGQTEDLNEKKEDLKQKKIKKDENKSILSDLTIIEEKTELELNEKQLELDKLQEREIELKKIQAQIPHVTTQIKDKRFLKQNYYSETEELEKENLSKFIPNINKLEKIESPTKESEQILNNKIITLRDISRKLEGLKANLKLLIDDKLEIEKEIGEKKYKDFSQVEFEKNKLKSTIEDQKKLIESHQEQINKISENIFKLEAKKVDIEEKVDNVEGLGDLCPICGTELDNEHKENLKSERKKEIKGINSEIKIIEEVRIRGNEELNDLKTDLKDFEDSLKELKETIEKITRLNKLKEKIVEIETDIEILNSDTVSIVDESLECHNLEEYINYYEILLETLREYLRNQKELKSFLEQLERNKKKIEDDLRNIKILEVDIHSLELNLSEYEEKSKGIDFVLNEIKNIKSDRDDASNKAQKTRENIASTRTLLNSLEEDINQLNEEIKKKESLKKQLYKLKDYNIWFNEYLIPTLSLIEKHVMQNIHQEFNENFKKWFGLLMDDPSKTGKINEEFTPIVEQDGFEQEINYLSGGEKTSVALAYRLALNNIVQKVSTGMKSNLLILDEPTDGFSKEQLFKVRDILNELDCPQIIIVSHERELESFADNVFRVEKVDGVSKVIALN